MILTEAHAPAAYRARLQRIIALADNLNDEGARAVLELIARTQSEITHALASDLTDFGARRLRDVRRATEAAARALVTRYGETFPGLAARAAELGVTLADEPLEAAGYEGAGGVIPRSVLETLTRYSADLITGVSRDVVSKTNLVLTQATLGVVSPAQAVQQIAGDLPGRSIFPSLKARAETIVRTEIGRAFSVTHQARLEQQAAVIPGLGKRWLSAEDARVRPTHADADGQVRPVQQPFSIGGYSAMYPRDPSLPASESVNCRCYSVPVLPDQT